MPKLTSYEFLGSIVPGVVLVYGLGLLFPDLGLAKASEKVSFGDVGLLLVLAYVGGQLLSSLGNVIEDIWWRFFAGWPSDWVYTSKGHILSAGQYQDLFKKIAQMQGKPAFDPNSDDSKPWKAITRQVYISVAKAGGAARVDIFNGNYGMFRGVVAAAIAIASVGELSGRIGYQAYWALILISSLAVNRMHRFAKLYAQELFSTFLLLDLSAPARAGEEAELAAE